jgi:hypothetical protein
VSDEAEAATDGDGLRGQTRWMDMKGRREDLSCAFTITALAIPGGEGFIAIPGKTGKVIV